VRRWTKKICRRAGVPVVNPQGNRGLHASIAREAGATGHVVMKQLGHGAESVHERHYAAEGAVAQGNVRRLSEVLQGGR
jgi:integrase